MLNLRDERNSKLSETCFYIFIITILNQATGQVFRVYFPSECIDLPGKLLKEGLDKFFPKSGVGQFEKVRWLKRLRKKSTFSPSAPKGALILPAL
jgi:hypothetical protein